MMLRTSYTELRSTERGRLSCSASSALTAGLLALSFSTVTTHAARLSELVDDALAHDATFASAEASYRAGLQKEPEALALLPHLGLTQSDFKNAIHVPGQPAAPYSTVGAALSLNQSLFKWDDWESYQESKLSVIGAGFTSPARSRISFCEWRKPILIRFRRETAFCWRRSICVRSMNSWD